MPHDDQPSDRPDPRPYRDYEGPLGFADAGDGGYPVESDLDDHPRPGAAQVSAKQAPTGRRLHNPLPPIETAEDDGYDSEPARTDWRKLTPIALTLTAAIGLGIWLAVGPGVLQASDPGRTVPTHQPQRKRDVVVTPTRTDPSSFSPLPTTPWKASPTPSATPTPLGTPSARRSPPPTLNPRPSSRPTVTITKTVKTTAAPTPRRTSPTSTSTHASGPEEPPGNKPSTTGLPAPTCRTWAECHDGPPED